MAAHTPSTTEENKELCNGAIAIPTSEILADCLAGRSGANSAVAELELRPLGAWTRVCFITVGASAESQIVCVSLAFVQNGCRTSMARTQFDWQAENDMNLAGGICPTSSGLHTEPFAVLMDSGHITSRRVSRGFQLWEK
jgi:hypothetical protein